MKRVMVAIFTKDRYEHLLLCQKYLRRSKDVSGFEFHFVAFDDSSTDQRVLAYLKKAFGNDVIPCHHCSDDFRPASCPPIREPGQRIGCNRHIAVNTFLTFSNAEYLLLLDDDIIVSKSTIANAVEEYELASRRSRIGGMSLYIHPKHVIAPFKVKGSKYQFGAGDLTGDAHMLFSRKSLEEVGNNFSALPGGFADNQIKKIIEKGMTYFTRIHPTYEIQHIGFGEGASLIQSQSQSYFWTQRPYWTYKEPKKVIQVNGFDILQYANLVMQKGALKAAKTFR